MRTSLKEKMRRMKKMSDKYTELIKKKIKPYFEKGGSHEFSHTQRVFENSLLISHGEKVDIDVVRAAALLHDIARSDEDCGKIKCHAEEGAIRARKILAEINFPPEKIKRVAHAIEVHRHSKNLKTETKEDEILQDADRLDALGAITVARMFSSGGKMNIPLYAPEIPFDRKSPSYDSYSTIHGFHKKILKITPETFKTKKAREIAKGRYKFVQEFLDRFIKEWEGKL